MCFSEGASFTAAAVLSGQAVVSYCLIKKEKAYAYFCFVLIPLFFAIQQFSEGIIWNTFNETAVPALLENQSGAYFFAYVFLSFAFLGWPIIIPLSLYFPEKDRFKKKLLFLFVILGLIWAFYLIIFLNKAHLYVTTEGRGIIYQANYFREESVDIMRFIYLGLLMIPIFISSIRLIWIFGFFTLLSALIAEYFYATSFTSVWCFFGALLSLILYFILLLNIKPLSK